MAPLTPLDGVTVNVVRSGVEVIFVVIPVSSEAIIPPPDPYVAIVKVLVVAVVLGLVNPPMEIVKAVVVAV